MNLMELMKTALLLQILMPVEVLAIEVDLDEDTVNHLSSVDSCQFSDSFGVDVYRQVCTLITFTSKAPPRDLYPMYPMVHQGKLVVLRGTPSKPVVTVVQQLVLKNGYHMVAVPSRSKKRKG